MAEIDHTIRERIFRRVLDKQARKLGHVNWEAMKQQINYSAGKFIEETIRLILQELEINPQRPLGRNGNKI